MSSYDVLAHAQVVAARRRAVLSLLSPWREGLKPALRAAKAALKRQFCK